jgi:hypothetical protein
MIGPECHISASDATRYLSAAPHLRRGMLRQKIIGLGQSAAPPQPVGRTYAIRVLFGAEGAVPMSAVDTVEVRGQCTIALLQTIIRDVAVIATVITSALLQPWGTAIVFGVAVAVIALVGRVPLFSPWTAAAVAAAVFVLFMGIDRGEASFVIPLICLGVCYVIFLTDTMLSVHHLRKLWHISPIQQESHSADSVLDGRSEDEAENSKDSQGPSQQKFGVSEPGRIYHDSNRIIGSGAPLEPLTFHVSLEKRLDADEKIVAFKASELVAEICSHVTAQSVGGAQENGYAYETRSEDRTSRQSQESSFTHDLPYMRVGPVISVPVPKAKNYPVLRFSTVNLNYNYRPSADELLATVNRPQIGENERYYVRASTPSWRGQIVVTIYCYVAMEADSLNVTIRPYVLTPIAGELRVAEDLATQNRFLMFGRAARMTVRQFLVPAQRISRLRVLGRDEARTSASGLYSVRERYAGVLADNTNQRDDAIRIIRVLEAKVVRVTMKFLRQHNIDPAEDERTAIQSVHSYTVIGDIISAGPGSQVNTAKGDNIEQTNK